MSSASESAFRGPVPVNGAPLYVEWAGQGPGLVFVHAGIADARMWDVEFGAFRDRYRVLRFDIRGFGRSPMPPGRFAYHADVAGVMRAAGLARATLVGCSFGANLALETCLAYPEMVERLVLAAPGLGEGGTSEAMRRFIEEEEAAVERGDFDAATELNLRMWVDGPRRAPADVDPELRESVRVMQRDVFAVEMPEGVERERLDPPAGERLGEVAVPTLVVVGELDVPFMLEVAERVEREIRAARRVVIPDAAHMVTMERPVAFQRALGAFLEASRLRGLRD